MKTQTFLVLLAIALAGSASGESLHNDFPASHGLGDGREVEVFFDELITRQLREEHVAGATVAVVKDGELVFAKGRVHYTLVAVAPVVCVVLSNYWNQISP